MLLKIMLLQIIIIMIWSSIPPAIRADFFEVSNKVRQFILPASGVLV